MNSIIGKIHCVSCRNFLTYDNVTIYPGEYLNVILGPNGTGKSALIAAIVLGLGGSEKLLARASGLKNYVKNGRNSAWICVKIYKDTSRNTVDFELSFQLVGKSEYKVNGKIVKKTEFLANVQKYNIQVTNLCQFLPQDRVQDFAKMNAQELFSSTVGAVCKKSTIENFAKLKEASKTLVSVENILNEERKKLEEVQNILPEFEAKVLQLQSRNKCLKEIEICLIKKAWLEFNSLKEKVKKTQKELSQSKVFLERDERNYDEIKKKMDKSLGTIETFHQNGQKKKKNEIANNSNELDRLSTEFEELSSTIRRKKNELGEKIAEQSDKEEELKRNMVILTASVQELIDLINKYTSENEIEKNSEELNQKIVEINSEIRKHWESHRKLTRQLQDNFEEELGNIKRKIHAIENVAARKLQMLQCKFEHVYNAVIWLRRNRHLFQSRIYEPMLLEMNVKDASYAVYFENTVRLADLLAFTCVDKRDFNLLVTKLMNEQELEVNIIHSDEVSSCNYSANKSIEIYARYGLNSFLIDMVEGPASILNYLCREYHIHEILIGTSKANNHADDVPNEVFLFFTPEYKYSISFSKYSGNKSLMREHISAKNLLCTDINKMELVELKQRMKEITVNSDILKNQRSVVERKINELEARKSDLVELRRANDLNRAKISKCRNETILHKQKIENRKKSHIDVKEEEKLFKEAANKLVQECLQNRQKSLECLQKYEKCVEGFEYWDGKLQVYKELYTDLEHQERKHREKFHQSQQLFDLVTAALKRSLTDYEDKLKEVTELCKGKMPDSPDFPLTRKFNQLPDDIPLLREHIEEIQSKLNCLEEGSDKIVKKYEELRTRLETLKSTIKHYSKEQESVKNVTSNIHEEWSTEISEVVKQINLNFTRLMGLMGYAGEIQLIFNNPYDYDSYGIKILVQYRNNIKLQVLDRYVQSGGERAVAIAVYSLSLQHLTHVPFRCVDEINQGMDSQNETKVFDLLVDETCRIDQPQYFFVSPKLLPNLKYNDLMTVHIVSNAKFIDKSIKFI